MGSGAGAPEAEGRSPWNRRGQLHLSENRRTKNSPEMPGGFFFFFLKSLGYQVAEVRCDMNSAQCDFRRQKSLIMKLPGLWPVLKGSESLKE